MSAIIHFCTSSVKNWSVLIILGLTSFLTFSQICEGSYDLKDLDKKNGVIRIENDTDFDTRFDKRYSEYRARQDKGFSDLIGLHFEEPKGYYEKDEQLYYSSSPGSFSLIPAGDVYSMRLEGNYLMDKNQVYSQGKPIPNLKSKWLSIVEGTCYAVGKEHVYYSETEEGESDWKGVVKVEGANPKKFKKICKKKAYGECNDYGTDGIKIYYLGWPIEDADPKSFILIENGFSRDKDFVYYLGEKVEGATSSSFEILSYEYQKDENNVYYYGTKIEGMNSSSFHRIGYSGMYSDGVHLCYELEVFESSDPATLVDLGCGYYKDANNIYSKGRILESIDKASFEILDWGYTKDKDAVYCDDNLIYGALPASFEILGRKYACDKEDVFYLNKALRNCDRASFVADPADDNLGEDAAATYVRGERFKK